LYKFGFVAEGIWLGSGVVVCNVDEIMVNFCWGMGDSRVCRESCLRYAVIFMVALGCWLAGSTRGRAQLVMGARSLAMGQAAAAMDQNPWGLFANPATLDESDLRASFYGVRYYGFSELTDMSASVSTPIAENKWGVGGVAFHRYGFDLYQEQHIRAGYAYRWKNLRAGIGLNYTHMRIERYGSAGTISVDVGLLAEINDQLTVGSYATNLNRARLGQAEEELPRQLTIGAAFTPVGEVLITVDAVKDVKYPLSIRGGAEVELFERLFIRGGVSTEPVTFSLGLGFQAEKWGINIAAQRHQLLGISPGLDLSVAL
jgi:hypothetical protein